MGLGCGKAHLPQEDDVVVGGRQGQKTAAKEEDEVTAEPPREEGGSEPSSSQQERRKKKQKPEETDVVAELLKRAQAGSPEEQVAAALAAEPQPGLELDDGEDGDAMFLRLLGGDGGPSQATQTRASGSSSGGAKAQSTAGQDAPHWLGGRSSSSSSSSRPPKPASKPAGHSKAVMRAAAKAGVPLPPIEDDESYGLLDEYVDELLGVPEKEKQRPKGWQRPSMKDSDLLKGGAPDIIFNDGSRGPPFLRGPDPEESPLAKPPDVPRPSLVPPPGSTFAPKSPDEYMNGVISGWASIDAGPKTDILLPEPAIPEPAAPELPTRPAGPEPAAPRPAAPRPAASRPAASGPPAAAAPAAAREPEPTVVEGVTARPKRKAASRAAK